MKINIYRRHECSKASGLCVVIDVLRAFTTAAFAFGSGVNEIFLVSSKEEAFQKYLDDSSLILMGEQEGRPIEGFHFGNSPCDIQQAILSGRRVVQRTSAGTQGVVGCRHASHLLIASFVVAEATLKRILALNPSIVSFIVTGVQNGDEDLALAEYLQSKLSNQKVSVNAFLDRVRASPEGKVFADLEIPEFSQDDLELALQVDRFPFAMEVFKLGSDLVARKVVVDG